MHRVYAVVLSDSEKLTDIDIQFVPSHEVNENADMKGEDSLEMVEEKAIRAAMNRFGGNLSMVAKSLEISRPTLYAKLKKYNI